MSKFGFDFGGDYYASSIGFVLDGQIFQDRDTALKYLETQGCMERDEAEKYISRMLKAFAQKRREAV